MKGKKRGKETERWKKIRHEARGLSEMKNEEKTINNYIEPYKLQVI